MHDYRAVPARTLAALIAGLRDDSRIAQAERDIKGSHDTILLASIADGLMALLYGLSGGKGEKPESFLTMLDESKQREKKKVQGFKDAAAFERARARLIKRARQDG